LLGSGRFGPVHVVRAADVTVPVVDRRVHDAAIRAALDTIFAQLNVDHRRPTGPAVSPKPAAVQAGHETEIGLEDYQG